MTLSVRLVGLAAALFLSLPASAADRPPNVVLILADDHGFECLGANGGGYQTPNLDKLAAGGVRFTHCYALPLCTPSRVQIMTGKYNFRNYVRFGEFDFRERTFAHALKDAGYATCIAGKWQLGAEFDGPKKAGFDDFCLWQFNPTYRGNRYADPVLFRNGQRIEGLQKRYGPDVLLEHVTGFVTANKDRPFLVYWPAVLTHGPFDPTPDSPAGRPDNDPKNFPDMVTYLDKQVGKLVAHLEKEGLRQNTLILFTGDNGTGGPITSKLNGKDYRGGKGKTTTAGTHVPLIASWPGKAKAGTVCDDLIDFTDVLPTLVEAAGGKPPGLDGRSFLPQVRGEKGTPREWVFGHYEPRQGKKDRKERYAHDHRWKLYQDGRLFDMQADPDEAKPVGDGPEAKAARGKLQPVLDRFEKEKPFAKD